VDDFEAAYQRYFSAVHRYTLRLTRDAHTAEELTAETFFRALKAWKRFDPQQCDVRIWLCQIAKNLWISQLRKQGRTFPLEDQFEEPASPVLSMERLLENKEDARRLHALLHQLEEPYKEVFGLRTFGELPFAEIAALFQKTEGWARVTYHRAKLKLTRGMEEPHEN
jgi:RNA polymerase sigma-70 factor (ECF subfamily)